MNQIHKTAIIHSGASLGKNVSVGPYSVVGEHVSLADGVTLHSHVVISGHTSIGEETEVFPFASLGSAPQDLKFGGEESRLEIGARNVIREHVTMNPGTKGGGLLTKVGDDGLFMMATHVAHDCTVGNGVIMANNATLAGHVDVGDGAVIGGLAAVHQFVRIGAYSMIGGMAGVAEDVMPFGSVVGERGHLAGLNLVGMKRRKLSRETIHALRGAYKKLFVEEAAGAPLSARAEQVAEDYADIAEVQQMAGFFTQSSSRSFCTPKEAASR